GQVLATLIQSCLRTSGPPKDADAILTGACAGLGPLRAGSPVPRPASYGFDHGWRWNYLGEGVDWRIVVAPDPLVGAPGPVFELDRQLRLVRRENGDAPAFFIWRGLALVTSYRECLI